MNPSMSFTVLIERRAGLRWLGAVSTSAALLFGLLHTPVAYAQNAFGKSKKVASDLQSVLDAGSTPAKSWTKDINGVLPASSADCRSLATFLDLPKAFWAWATGVCSRPNSSAAEVLTAPSQRKPAPRSIRTVKGMEGFMGGATPVAKVCVKRC